MVTTWWVEITIVAIIGALLSFWGWLACKVVEQNGKIADIQARVAYREIECTARLAWMQRIEAKVSIVGDDVAVIRGALKPSNIVDSNGKIRTQQGDNHDQ